MFSVLYSIYVPDDNNYFRFVKSISSFVKSLHPFESFCHVIIDGWCEGEYWLRIETLLSHYPSLIYTINRRKENVGKAVIINSNLSNFRQYVLLIDHDIIFPQNVVCFLLSYHRHYDILIPNQADDNRHFPHIANTDGHT